jgi:hypothetical protein
MPPPRSAAIAISQRANGHRHGEETETGYGQHVREGIAWRKENERETREREGR